MTTIGRARLVCNGPEIIEKFVDIQEVFDVHTNHLLTNNMLPIVNQHFIREGDIIIGLICVGSNTVRMKVHAVLSDGQNQTSHRIFVSGDSRVVLSQLSHDAMLPIEIYDDHFCIRVEGIASNVRVDHRGNGLVDIVPLHTDVPNVGQEIVR